MAAGHRFVWAVARLSAQYFYGLGQALRPPNFKGDAALWEPELRALLAIMLIASGAVALPVAADAGNAARSRQAHAVHPRYYQPRYYRPYRPRDYYQQPGYAYRPGYNGYYSSEQAECERRAEAEDPSGMYAGYPCWARAAFGRSGGGGRR
jgi:hypothetical protein